MENTQLLQHICYPRCCSCRMACSCSCFIVAFTDGSPCRRKATTGPHTNMNPTSSMGAAPSGPSVRHTIIQPLAAGSGCLKRRTAWPTSWP